MPTSRSSRLRIPSNHIYSVSHCHYSGSLFVYFCFQDKKFLTERRDKTGENQRKDHGPTHKLLWIVPLCNCFGYDHVHNVC